MEIQDAHRMVRAVPRSRIALDPARGLAVAVRIAQGGAAGVLGRVAEQPRGFGDDARRIGPHEDAGAGGHALRPLRAVAQDQDRLAQGGRLLLHPARIREDEGPRDRGAG
jgi:hypothetical protein